jgi:hypothetical protein
LSEKQVGGREAERASWPLANMPYSAAGTPTRTLHHPPARQALCKPCLLFIVRRAGMYGGLRAKGDKADLALITCETGAVAAGVFTLNVMCAAPVTYCKEILAKTDTVKAVLVRGAGWGCGRPGAWQA